MTAQIETDGRDRFSREGNLRLRQKRYQLADQMARQEIAEVEEVHAYGGEPSGSFYPAALIMEDVEAQIVFDASTVGAQVKGREGDLAKRRAALLNALLQDPAGYPMNPENLTIVERQWERLLKFANTLKNKGKLHPGIDRILDL